MSSTSSTSSTARISQSAEPITRLPLPPPPVEGITFRYFRDPSDYTGMATAFAASVAADNIETAFSPEDMEHLYSTMSNFDLYRDLLLIEASGKIISYSSILWWDELEGTRISTHFTFLVPEWRDRGLQPSILHHCERRLLEIAATHLSSEHPPTGSYLLEAAANDMDPGRHALLQSAGYSAVRYMFRMIRPNLEDIPNLPLPEGIEARPVTPDQYRTIWDSSNEAAADHWGMPVLTEEDYQSWLGSSFFQPDLWQVAWDGDEAIGSILNFVNHEENRTYNRARGYTENIGVRKQWRRRGIARALLARSLRMHRDMGMIDAALMVDTENPHGALQLYESMDFSTVTVRTTYRKPLPHHLSQPST